MPVTFSNPSGFFLLLLLVPIVLLYVLTVRRARQVVSSVWLWSQAERDLIAKNPFRRLKPFVSLLLQCLAVIALALASSEPTMRSAGTVGDAVGLVLDVSASMAAVEPSGQTRLKQAQDRALDILEGLPAETEVLVIAAGAEPHVVSPPERDRRRLAASIQGLEIRGEEAHLDRALVLATDRLASSPGDPKLLVLTDTSLDVGGSRARVPIEVIRIGTDLDNVSIVRIDSRRAVDPSTRTERVDTFAAIENHGRVAADRFVTLRQKNTVEPLASRRVRIESGERAFVVLSFSPAKSDENTGLVVELSPGDALSLDDRAQTTVPAGRRLPVVLVSEADQPWLARALAADPDVELFRTSPAELTAAAVPDGALIIAAGFCPSTMVAGDLLIVDPPQGRCLDVAVGDVVRSPSITSWADKDARLAFLTLGDVGIRSGRTIERVSPASRLVRAGEAVLVADASVFDRHVTIVGFDVAESDWPLKPSFVVFLRNIAELARTTHERSAAVRARTGEPLALTLPPGVDEVIVEGPDGAKTAVAARHPLTLAQPPTQPGFYHAHWEHPSPGSRLIAVNLDSDREGDLRNATHDMAAAVASPEQSPIARVTSFAWVGALLGLSFVLGDAWWATRTLGLRRRRSQNARGAR